MGDHTVKSDGSVLESNNRLNNKAINPIYPALIKAAAVAILYIILIFALPLSQSDLGGNLSNFAYKVIRFYESLPLIMVWLVAFTGCAVLRKYAVVLLEDNSKEGKHFNRLADGCYWLAWSLPVTALSELILSSMAYEWHGFEAMSVVIGNYINLVIPLVAFSLIGTASRGLVASIRLRISLSSARIIVAVFLVIGVLYCFLTFSHFDLGKPGSVNNPYHLPVWLMALTVIIPYLYVWFIGLLASFELSMFSQKVTGLIYKRALRLLAGGLVLIIASSIAIEYLSGVKPNYGHLVLNYALVIDVIFRILSGIGFILVTLGAFRLNRIEEL